MTEKLNDIDPYSVDLYQLRIDRRKSEKEPDEPQFEVTVGSVKRKENSCGILFEMKFIFKFTIKIEMIALFYDENLKDLTDKELLELAIANSYSVYSKMSLTLAFVFEQMGLNALFIPYSMFLKLAKKEEVA